MSRTALVIGGSGMLQDVVKHLAQTHESVGVVGRSKEKMAGLEGVAGVVPIYVDYTDIGAFRFELQRFTEDHGMASTCIAWVHAEGAGAVTAAASSCNGRFYEITGSPDSDNHALSFDHETIIAALPIEYTRITLAKMGDRWLTNEEISQGVIKSLGRPETHLQIGNFAK
jgi:hypothetical protein